MPFALRYRLQFRAGPAAGAATGQTGTKTNQTETALEPTKLLLPDPAALPAPQEHPTFAALREYREFLAARGARLVVLVLSNQPEALMAYRFCKEQGIEAHLFDVPPGMRIPDEGHFNAFGNAAVAALAQQLLRKAPNGAGS